MNAGWKALTLSKTRAFGHNEQAPQEKGTGLHCPGQAELQRSVSPKCLILACGKVWYLQVPIWEM